MFSYLKIWTQTNKMKRMIKHAKTEGYDRITLPYVYPATIEKLKKAGYVFIFEQTQLWNATVYTERKNK